MTVAVSGGVPPYNYMLAVENPGPDKNAISVVPDTTSAKTSYKISMTQPLTAGSFDFVVTDGKITPGALHIVTDGK